MHTALKNVVIKTF